jgi:phosphoglycerate-specific signal transduction histidine kinase
MYTYKDQTGPDILKKKCLRCKQNLVTRYKDDEYGYETFVHRPEGSLSACLERDAKHDAEVEAQMELMRKAQERLVSPFVSKKVLELENSLTERINELEDQLMVVNKRVKASDRCVVSVILLVMLVAVFINVLSNYDVKLVYRTPLSYLLG